jgi:LPPG:FO 2-phospho-L-lactate transferase
MRGAPHQADLCTLLSGGVGGAKLALGLSRVLAPESLTIIANTGDDFRHLGLKICPDLDTLMYTLADLVNSETGWGRREETWRFMAALEQFGGETWFRLGDADLACHVERTRRLSAGDSLSEITQSFCARLGVGSRILPMSDEDVSTRVQTSGGELEFQDYFVRQRAQPALRAVRFDGASVARPAGGVLEALTRATAILIAPSNPYLSIDPILSVPGLRSRIAATRESRLAPVVAVSPIVAGQALKGPTAKIMAEFGHSVGPVAIARHYAGLLDGIVVDDADAGQAAELRSLGVAVAATQTVMNSEGDKMALARFTLQFAETLQRRNNC